MFIANNLSEQARCASTPASKTNPSFDNTIFSRPITGDLTDIAKQSISCDEKLIPATENVDYWRENHQTTAAAHHRFHLEKAAADTRVVPVYRSCHWPKSSYFEDFPSIDSKQTSPTSWKNHTRSWPRSRRGRWNREITTPDRIRARRCLYRTARPLLQELPAKQP